MSTCKNNREPMKYYVVVNVHSENAGLF